MMMKRLIAVLLVAMQVALPVCGWGATYYVDDSCTTNCTDNTCAECPCTTGARSITIQGVFTGVDLNPLDFIYVCNGVYPEIVTWMSGDVGDNTGDVTMIGESETGVILDGGNIRTNCITQSTTGLDYISIERLTVQNATGRNIFFEGASGIEDQSVNLRNITSIGSVDGIILRNKSNSAYDKLTISGASQDAFQLFLNGSLTMHNITTGDIDIVGGNSETGSFYLQGIDGLNLQGDITVSNPALHGVYLSSLGAVEQDFGTKITVSAAGGTGVYLYNSLGLWDYNGEIISTGSGGYNIHLQTLGTGEKNFASIAASSGQQTGVYANLSTITIDKIVSSSNTVSGVIAEAGSVVHLNGPASRVSGNAHDGISAFGDAQIYVSRVEVDHNGGGDGIPTIEGDGLTGHGTSIIHSVYNYIHDNDNSAFATIDSSSLISKNDTAINNGQTGGHRGNIYIDNIAGTIFFTHLISTGGLPYEIMATDATALGVITSDYNIISPVLAATAFATVDGGTTPLGDIAAWRTASANDANSQQVDPLIDSTGHPAANSPAINAGIIIAGIHDQATPATDTNGTPVLTIPDIGAYEYPGGLYFNAASTDGGNGTRALPYNAWTDYLWTGYNLRAGAEIYLQGAMAGTLDLSGLTDTGEIFVLSLMGKPGSITGFIGNGPETKFDFEQKRGLYAPLWE